LAVGYSLQSTGERTLAEHWNGGSWAILTVGTPGAGLSAVSCSSADSCTALGGSPSGALAERWNGSTWSAQAIPSPAGGTIWSLNGISCPSAASCRAVGQYRQDTTGGARALAEHWNGSTWSVQEAAQPNRHDVLNAVSCAGYRTCTAVGFKTVPGTKLYLPLAEQE
jgi:hypothetical protein